MRTIRERVKDSYSDEETDKVTKYLDWLNASISDVAQNIRRSTLLILLLIAAFELVSTAPSEEVKFSIFIITKGSVVLQFIPALISYLFLQIYIDSINIKWMLTTFRAAFTSWSSSASKNDLDIYILPRFHLFWTPGFNLRAKTGNEQTVVRAEQITRGILFAVVIVGTFIFEAQAYSSLRGPRSSTPSLAWFASLVISIFCALMLIAFVFTIPEGKITIKQLKRPRRQ